ncbi:bis(5'-nucleosyl)-tetraphosphatase, symmetrical [bacterium endosymbiont of Mortierella elongata FMR23-6]|nr:bis(5'-nucleosyl)-tetraphosphatase, symmetrical [bacterium endosymbiont of Mortierella elongata FMR23-6]
MTQTTPLKSFASAAGVNLAIFSNDGTPFKPLFSSETPAILNFKMNINHSSAPPPLAFGDLQGCHGAFRALLAKAAPTPNTPLWFAGDLINRGPHSLACLHDVIDFGQRAVMVLGNHELHLLAVAAGVQRIRKGDTINEILAAPDAADLIDWLRHRPLTHYQNGMLMVHAGVLPQWDLTLTLELAHELEQALRGPAWRDCIAQLSLPRLTRWHPGLTRDERLRITAHTLTHIRFCNPEGELEFNAKGGPDTAPPGYLPWFDAPDRRTAELTIVFGHWAALGLLLRDKLCALDSGCVWGKQLSALTLDPEPSQRKLIQVTCPTE